MAFESAVIARVAAESEASFEGWPQNWRAQALVAPPLISPTRQYVYPRQIAGEEDALARGAFQLLLYPGAGGSFLATCVRGFKDPAMPTGVFACPNPDEFCALAGGYGYIVNPSQPEICTHLAIKPIVEVRAFIPERLLIFVGFHHLMAWGQHGMAWETARLSWEGIRLTEAENGRLSGFGWNLQTDREVSFSVDLKAGGHTGGGF